MTFSIGLLLAIIVAGLVLFSLELFSADITALAILLTLVLTGLLPAGEAFAGFGSDAVIMILGLFILTAALVQTGVVDRVSQFILNNTSSKLNRLNRGPAGAIQYPPLFERDPCPGRFPIDR